jgi:HEAT repeat protein
MRLICAAGLAALLVLVNVSCVPTGPAVQPVSREIAVRGEASTTLEAAYSSVIDALLPGMGHAEDVQRTEAQTIFEKICLRAARPGAETQRLALCRAITTKLGPETLRPARVWMLRQLERAGSGEVVVIAGLLNDESPPIRECARRCLEHNPDPASGEALRNTLARTISPDWRVALINSLGARGEQASVAMLSEMVADEDPAVAAAAVAALGDIGGIPAVEALAAARLSASPDLRAAVTNAYLRCAQRFSDEGITERAAKIYEELYVPSESRRVRIAALSGLVRTRPEQTLPLLLDLITDDDESMRVVAARLAEEIPGQSATHILANKLADSSPAAQVLLLETLAARGDSVVQLAVVAALVSSDESVRIAALHALGKLGDRSTVLLFAQRAAAAEGHEQNAARQSLERLPGEGVDETMLSVLDRAEPVVRVELIRALGSRRFTPALPKLFMAAADTDESVQVAAFNVLADFAGEEDLPALLRLLVGADGQVAQAAAEEAVVSTCSRIDNADQRVGPILAALRDSRGAAKGSLIRVLGRLGGAKALDAIRAARAADDADVQDAVVRALADWKDIGVTEDLLRIAESSSNQTHRVLALRGYVRLVRLPSDREPPQTLNMLERAMALAERPEEKRLVLAGMADVPCLDALRMVEPYMSEEALRDEAAMAVLSVAQAVSAEHRDEALAAIERVRALSAGRDAVRKRLEQVVEHIDRFDSYATAWMIAGPYTEEGKNNIQLFDIPFGPELLGGEVEWRALEQAHPGEPWRFDLAKAVGGSNRCVYAKTMIFSDGEQPARLEVGSDDGVKVWLNGKVVHAANVNRGLTVAEDKVDIALNAGWNELLLKVVQGSGDWGFACGVRAPDGGKLEGIKFKAE